MIVRNADAETITVMLTDSTEVGQIQGVLKARRKEMSMAALIPGLAVQIEATHGEHNQLVAKSVKFKGDDLKRPKPSRLVLMKLVSGASKTQRK